MNLRPLSLAILPLLTLSGCGSSSDNSTPKPDPVSTVNGVASQGGPIQGFLNTSSVAAARSATTYALSASNANSGEAIDDGLFKLDLNNLSLPTILKIEGTNGGDDVELYSLILDNQHDTLNLSPLSRLLISNMTRADAAMVFANLANYQDALTSEKLAEAQQELRRVLAPLLKSADLNNDVDLLTTKTDPNYQGLDAVLGLLNVTFEADKATLSYRADESIKVVLPFDESWGNESFPERDYADDIKVMAQADAMLEEMILLNEDGDKAKFMSMVHPQASWFGVSGDAIFKSFSNGAPDEHSKMDRYRDFVVTKYNKDKRAYRISFTERFEAGKFASAGRQVAWFAIDDSDNQLKFLGEIDPLPTSANAFYKLYYFEEGYSWPNWQTGEQPESFSWALEVDAFVDSDVCQSLPDNGPWDWNYNNSTFVQSLPKVSAHLGFDHILVEGPGLEGMPSQKLDRIFKDPQLGGCHLIISDAHGDNTGGISPMMDGIYFNVDQATDNARYQLHFNDADGNTLWTKTIALPKGPENDTIMKSRHLPSRVFLSGAPNAFSYEWTRSTWLSSESDLWVYFTGHVGAGTRVAIADGETSVSLNDNNAIERVFHSSFDGYGRVLQSSYVKDNEHDHLVNK